MKALICGESPLIYITSLSPWKPKSPTLHQHRTWRVNAEAKGFGRAPPNNTQDQRSTRIALESVPVPRKTYQSNDSGGDDDDDDDKIPEVVFGRIITRILLSVGVPLATGLAFLQMFSVLKERQLWDVPLWLPFLTTFLTFGASALGIAYGTLSTSWDPERKGSLLGLEEAQVNWVEMWKEEEDRR